MKDFTDGFKCPVCGSKAYWNDSTYEWICDSCGYSISGSQVDCDDSGNCSVLGIDWYCDGCNAHLNKQSGFNQYADSWTCTKCGYDNFITKNNVV